MHRNRLMEPATGFALAGGLLFIISLLAIQSAWLSGGILVLWPADGLIVGLMLAPRTRRPWLMMIAGLIGVSLAFALVNRQMVLGWSRVGLMAVAIPCTYWAAKRVIGSRSIAELRVLAPFMTVCAVTGLTTSALRAYLIHRIWGFPFAQFTLTTATATFAGYAVITPLLLMITHAQPQQATGLRARSAMWGVVGLYIAGMTAAFMEPRYPTAYLLPVALILVAHTVDFTGIAVVILATAVISIGLTFNGYGPISHFPGDLKTKVLLTQAFLAIIICLTLPFSALTQDRRRLQRSLITALKGAEAASHAKSAFLATMSHEIRTPLNGVLGMAQAIAMGELNPVQRERLDVVRNSGETLLSLLNDVLDISKIEAGQLTLETIDFDLAKVIHAVVAQNQALAANKGIMLRACAQGAAGLYQGDPNRIRQIIQNLVSNALKFTDSGSVTITATARAEELQIHVTDTGIGIPADKLELLFQKFRQVDDSTTRRFGGTGLGLSICRELAQAMNGEVSVSSREGMGSTFTLRLPLPRSKRTALGQEASPPAAPEPAPASAPTPGLRVLAAEDNATNQLVLKTLLNAGGIHPTIVGNGAEALAAWASGAWDIILMDVHMPVMNGLEAVRAIRAQEAASGAPRTRIVALTADALDHQVRQYLAAGMDALLTKPISIEKLFEALAQADPAPEAAGTQTRIDAA
jgi:signal transduction histidine kinase/ActR/RegA family two-component response regulator